MRSALVTGAASGIGRAIAERLEKDGWQVHGVDVADGDLTTREGNRAVVEAALERFGRLDAVVANAGFQHVAPIRDFDEDRWDALVGAASDEPVPAGEVCLGVARRERRRALPRRRIGARARRVSLQGGLRLGQARRARAS